ncbi:hypothetical protein ACFOHK_16810 [Falsigemmobacter intermedius]
MVPSYSIDKSQPKRHVVRQMDGRFFILVAIVSHNLRGFLSGTSELLGWAVLSPDDSTFHGVVSLDPEYPSAWLDDKGSRYELITPPAVGSARMMPYGSQTGVSSLR